MCARNIGAFRKGRDTEMILDRSLRVPRTWTSGHDIALPIIPLWSGFLLNTLLIATLLFGMINGYPLARSTLRRRHHRCPTCNYNCRNLHSPTCPECGKPHTASTRP